MPYLRVETNRKIDRTVADELIHKAAILVARLLEKDEKWVMVTLVPGVSMFYAGEYDPAAFVELKSIALPEEKCTEISRQLCDFLQQELLVPPERVYVEFKDLDRKKFGWNGGTF